MQMFLRICMFVCLCIVFLFVFRSLDVYAQDPTLKVLTDSDQVYAVGETGMMAFLATNDAGLPAAGVELTITYNGLTGVTISNGGTTDRFGLVQVTGVIAAESGVYVEAEWSLGVRVLAARAYFEVVSAADRQEASLEILSVNPSREVAVGEVVKVSFQVSDNGTPVVGVPLTITHNGLRDVTIIVKPIINYTFL